MGSLRGADRARVQSVDNWGNGLHKLTEVTGDDNGVEQEVVRYSQRPNGRLPVNQVDTDDRWHSTRADRAGLEYQGKIVVDQGGFILSRGVTHIFEPAPRALPHSSWLATTPTTSVSGRPYQIQRRIPQGIHGAKERHRLRPIYTRQETASAALRAKS